MRKSTMTVSAGLLSAGLLALTTAAAPATAAVDLPCRTVKLIVPWGAGGGTDVVLRIWADGMNKAGADPRIQVVNISGQGGNKGAKEARKAKADGCTLFAMHQSALSSYLNGRVDFTYDAFAPIALLTRTPAIFGAAKDAPFNDLTQLITFARANPGKVNTGATLGSTSHFIYLLLVDRADIKLNFVSYDGTKQRMNALLAGTIHMGEINLAAAKQHIASGALKGLGITTEARHPDAADVATAREQGIDLVYGTDRGIVAPKGTPPEIIDYYAGLLKKAAASAAVREAIEAKGSEVIYTPPAAYKAYLDETFATWKRIAKDIGMYQGS